MRFNEDSFMSEINDSSKVHCPLTNMFTNRRYIKEVRYREIGILDRIMLSIVLNIIHHESGLKTNKHIRFSPLIRRNAQGSAWVSHVKQYNVQCKGGLL